MDQIHAVARLNASNSSLQTDWSRAIGVLSFGAFGQEHTEDHPGGTTYWWMPRLKSKAHHVDGHTTAADGGVWSDGTANGPVGSDWLMSKPLSVAGGTLARGY